MVGVSATSLWLMYEEGLLESRMNAEWMEHPLNRVVIVVVGCICLRDASQAWPSWRTSQKHDIRPNISSLSNVLQRGLIVSTESS